MPRVFAEGVRRWNCVYCGWTTGNSTFTYCPDCEGRMLIIPLILDNTLFVVVDDVVERFYKLDVVLNDVENAVELWDTNGERVATIRDWKSFQDFFGNKICRMYNVEEEENDN